MIYLNNSFSLNMLPVNFTGSVSIQPAIGLDSLLMSGSVINAIGHADTAFLVAKLLASDGINIPEAKRQNVTLTPNDVLIVAQYNGPRLPEGATTLPSGATFTFKEVSLC